MKSEIILPKEQPIDWSKPVLVKNEAGEVVFCCGFSKEGPSYFEGVLIKSNHPKDMGIFSSWWRKDCFTIFNGDIKLSND